jgi:DNA polymerase-3 subunit delta
MIRRVWYGDEAYLVHERLTERRQHFLKEHGELSVLDIQDSDPIERLIQSITTSDLFSPKKLIVVHGMPSIREDYQAHVEKILLDANMEHELILIHRGSPDKRRKFTKFLLEHFESEEYKSFAPWDAAKVRPIVQSMAEKDGFSWGPGALDHLMDVVGLDLWALRQNVEKLETVVLPEKIITRTWVEQIASEGEMNWFAAADALRKRNKSSWLQYCRESTKADEAYMILAMVANQVRLWIILKSLEGKSIDQVARQMGKSPYYLNKMLPDLRPWTLLQLRRVLAYLFQLEFDAKSGKILPAIGLEMLLGEPIWA